jgi:hypothetical protein
LSFLNKAKHFKETNCPDRLCVTNCPERLCLVMTLKGLDKL